MTQWGVKYPLSSAYYPQSSGRAEAAVKTLKRLLIGNTGDKGSIKTDQVAYALMKHRNTPLHGMTKSPAQLALGRPLRDSLPLPYQRYCVDPEWSKNIQHREISMPKMNDITAEKFDLHSKPLDELIVGTEVLCQNTQNCK